MKKFRVYETFSSIQGESSFAGLPCFFIRFAGCNLACPFCDTAKSQPMDAGREMTLDELLELVRSADLPLVELTGGEPLLQKELPSLAAELLAMGKTVLVETNGSMDRSVLPPEVHCILDIKTPSSCMQDRMFEPNFTRLCPGDEVKFVISDETDYQFACEAIRRFRLDSQIRHILFSPAWGTDLEALAESIVRDKLPVRLNLQLHKFIWGPTREGV